jgi:hypothetical protein
MTALAAERNTKERFGEIEDYPMKAATIGYAGGIAVLDAGYAAPGRTATGLVAVGRFEETKDNSAGAAGAIIARVKRGKFRFANSAAGDLIAQANVGADCYIVDDQTVALTSATSTRSRAGKIVGVDASGVWVQMGLGL